MSTVDEETPDVFDALSEEAHEDPYRVYHRIRAKEPVQFNPNDKRWYLFRYDDVVTALSDDASFQNANPGRRFNVGDYLCPEAAAILADRREQVDTLVTADAPDQPNIRGPLQRALYVRKLRAMEPGIESIARLYFDKFADAGNVDIVSEFTYPFPLQVVAEWLGVPREDFDDYAALTDSLIISVGLGLTLVDEAAQVRAVKDVLRLEDYLMDLVNDRKANPRDDFTSQLVQMERLDGRPYNDGELLDLMKQFSIGGHETTTSSLSVMFLELARNPEMQEELRRDPRGMREFVEEVVRIASPVQSRHRFAREDLEIGGCPVAAGSIVQASIAAANHDPAMFPDPEKFDPTRENLHQHIGFGRGIHNCLGSEIARREMRIALALALASMGDIRLAEPADEAFEWGRHSLLRGLESLKLTFTPLGMPSGSVIERALRG